MMNMDHMNSSDEAWKQVELYSLGNPLLWRKNSKMIFSLSYQAHLFEKVVKNAESIFLAMIKLTRYSEAKLGIFSSGGIHIVLISILSSLSIRKQGERNSSMKRLVHLKLKYIQIQYRLQIMQIYNCKNVSKRIESLSHSKNSLTCMIHSSMNIEDDRKNYPFCFFSKGIPNSHSWRRASAFSAASCSAFFLLDPLPTPSSISWRNTPIL